MEYILQCSALSKSFRSNTILGASASILKNIDCSIAPFSVSGITGESGCGKTTLSRCILNLIKPDSGIVLIHGRPVCAYGCKKEFFRTIQAVQQNPESALDPDFTVRRSLEEMYTLHKERFASKQAFLKELESLCKNAGIAYDELDRLPYCFSGGQLQRICIIRAVIIKPEILILDEPTSMLDVAVQAQILSLLSKLKEKYKLTLILISHDLNIIEYFCDYLIVMRAGSIVESGVCKEVFAHPAHEYTAALLKSRNLHLN